MRKNNYRRFLYLSIAVFLITCLIVYISFKDTKHKKPEVKISDVRFGIDISHHQKTKIVWDSIANKHPVEFVICRATRGAYYIDSCFLRNFSEAKSRGYKVGVYHYLESNEPVDSQAINYLRMSSILIKGDFRPIIDIEEGDSLAKNGDPMITDSLKSEIRWLLDTVTKKHGMTPIIYMNLNFYKNNFKKDSGFNKYPLWLAAYGEKYRKDEDIKRSAIYQFTDSVRIKGIKGYVDGNDIKKKGFDSLLLKK